jgi:acetolactate synthase I/II/III large subunit
MHTVGGVIAEFLAAQGVSAAYGVISIHNMPILDGFHTRGQIRFVPARGEAGACNMADAHARVSGELGVCVTSTGTGAGNAAGALIEALTAGTPMLHLTGQIESPYLDRDLGFIHEAPAQLAMLQAVSKASFRIRNPETALATLREATRIAFTAPCGPVSVEIAIDVQKMSLPAPSLQALTSNCRPEPIKPDAALVAELAQRLSQAKRPLLWLGGGARQAGAAVQRLLNMGFGVVTSVQGRGVVAEDHPQSLAAFNLQKASAALYAEADALLVVGSRLRSNETLGYHLALPKPLYRIDANILAEGRAYGSELFIHGDATLTLNALADLLSLSAEPSWAARIQTARAEAEAQVDAALAAYTQLKNSLNRQVQALAQPPSWVRDITLSNTMWGNRSLYLKHPKQGVHALGGGIGQGLAMGIGASLGSAGKAIALMGDGGLQLNLGELACAAQERANLLILVMNDGGYGVIKNIQDADYGSRHCYVDLHTPNFAQICQGMGITHLALKTPADTDAVLAQALAMNTPVMVEVDMHSWGPFAVKFAGPPRK